MLPSVAGLYVAGVALDWAAIVADVPAHPVSLPTYPFQRERYWIDTSRLRPRSSIHHERTADDADLNDWLYQLAWRPQLSSASEEAFISGSWLIFADGGGVGESVARLLRARGERCQLVFSGEQYAVLSEDRVQIALDQPEHIRQVLVAIGADVGTLRGIIHLWSLNHEQSAADALHDAHAQSCESLLHLVQSVAAIEVTPAPRIWVVTRGAQTIDGVITPGAPYQAPVWGLGNVIGLEHPTLWGGLIDLDPTVAVDQAAALVETIQSASGETQIAWRDGQRYVARLTRATHPKTQARPQVYPEGTYLITGGLGALGLLVARWLVDHGARHVALVGRSGASGAVETTLRELEARGAQVRVLRANVAYEAEVARLLQEIEATMPPLRGIFHAAGVLDDGVLLQQRWERFERVFAPKISGAWHLHRLTQHLALDYFVLFSSIASLLGSPGQGNYAAANAFLDALAHYRRSLELAAVSINWGAWGDSGMAAALTDRDQLRWTSRGIGIIPPDQGIRVLEQILTLQVPQIGVMPVEWERYAQQYPPGAERCLLAELVDLNTRAITAADGAMPAPHLREQFAAMPVARRYEALMQYVTGEVARVLMLGDDTLDPRQGLFDMGMDSLMALEFKNRVQTAFDHAMPSTLLFNYPTIEAVVEYLQQTVFGEQQAAAPLPPQPVTTDHLESLLDNLEQLSDEEIDRLFADKLAGEGYL
jgi:acyl transferase domain-containing protein